MLIYLVNFLFVFVSIVLFIVPFFAWYWWRHKDSLKVLGFNHYLENFFSSKQANWLVFAWAAGEARKVLQLLRNREHNAEVD